MLFSICIIEIVMRKGRNIIKDLFFDEINLLTEDINEETGLYMISSIAQLKDN